MRNWYRSLALLVPPRRRPRVPGAAAAPEICAAPAVKSPWLLGEKYPRTTPPPRIPSPRADDWKHKGALPGEYGKPMAIGNLAAPAPADPMAQCRKLKGRCPRAAGARLSGGAAIAGDRIVQLTWREKGHRLRLWTLIFENRLRHSFQTARSWGPGLK